MVNPALQGYLSYQGDKGRRALTGPLQRQGMGHISLGLT